MKISDACVVVFFPNREAFDNGVIPLIRKDNIDCEIIDGGVIIVSKLFIDKFVKAGFDFIITKRVEELYANYAKELGEYAQQIRRFYGLPERDCDKEIISKTS